MASEFEPDYVGIRAFLMTDPALDAFLLEQATQVYNYAESISPDKTGEYKSGMYLEKHISSSRMSYRVGNTSFKAWWIEYGTKKMAKYAVLRRALASVQGIFAKAEDYAGITEYDTKNKSSQFKRQLNRTTRARKSELRGK